MTSIRQPFRANAVALGYEKGTTTVTPLFGVGDVRHFEDQPRWKEAAEKGMADEIVGSLPAGYGTQLGNHEELMALDGHYARLFLLQAAGYR